MKYLVIFALSSFLACSNGNDLTISVTDSDDEYEFYAKFDEQKTQRVQDFINTKIAPGSSITGDHVDITTTLDDKTQFKLEEYPGKVRIKLDKDENSTASYQRVKAICEGLKQVIEAK